MHLTTWFVIVPLCLAALLTGIVQSLGTTWGLFRHHWIVTKLLLTVLATVILLVHTQPIDRVAAVAAQTTLAIGDRRQLRFQLVGDACAALFVLLVTTTLSVYKPWGMTPYGLRMQNEMTGAWRPNTSRQVAPWGRYVLFGIIGVVLLVLLLHLVGIGLERPSGRKVGTFIFRISPVKGCVFVIDLSLAAEDVSVAPGLAQ
jgi:hypothetical protein